MTKKIFITTQFEGLHRYPDAPEEVKYLRNLHRHMFHVKVTIEVKHNDRELEFIMVKHAVEDELSIYLQDFAQRVSCEDIAEHLVKWAMKRYGEDRHVSVEVNEDRENGAIVSN